MSEEQQLSHEEIADVQHGLRMAHPPDPVRLAMETEQLARMEGASRWRRLRHYTTLIGPGYMQSAMTLGGSTAASSLFAGALFGYKLLWVAPVAMLMGIVMLSAVSYQTLSTGMRPYDAMTRYAGKPFALGWAIGALLSSIIWHFPQYALAASMLQAMGAVGGFDWQPRVLGFVVLAWAVLFSFLYGLTPALVRWYERALKYMVWGVVLCFAVVVVQTGVKDWGALLRGFFTFEIPGERNGQLGVVLVVSGMAAAVGVNMLFLYPYSLLARGWSRVHRRLARFDLYVGMLLPYVLATSLMIIATANTLHPLDPGVSASSLRPVDVSRSVATVVGDTPGILIFGIGILGMALSSITLQMLTAGFVCSEVFGWKFGGWKYRLATLLPTPGVLGPVFWNDIAVWLAVPTSIICGLFMPLAYVGFIILQRNRRYLAGDTPRGSKGAAWLGGMVVATLVLTSFLGWYVINKGPEYVEKIRQLFGAAS